jgi:hypothetical protein
MSPAFLMPQGSMNPPCHNLNTLRAKALGLTSACSSRAGWIRLAIYRRLGEEALVADVNEVERALTGAIKKRMLEGSGKLSKVTTIGGIVQVTFLEVTDDAHVFDTLSGALLDLRIQLEVVPDLDVKIRRK